MKPTLMTEILSGAATNFLPAVGSEHPSRRNGPSRFQICLGSICVFAVFLVSRAVPAANYTAHEWGTFTSVQGSNGELLSWRPLESSELPKFVFSTTGSSLIPGPVNVMSKVNLITLQRMETPVIYFYADQPMNVDVNVAFPKGFLTEWYPQTTEVGPAAPQNANTPATGILRESRAIWRSLQIIPQTKDQPSLADSLPQEKSGSHYFAARETAASYVRANFPGGASELEKFVFYRGAGSFKTPLRVTVDSKSVVSVENTGAQALTHLFLLNIHDGKGSFGVLDELASGNSVTWLPLNDDTAEHWRHLPLPQFQNEIATQIQAALTAEGLFPDEAKAMVNTWKDSWFTEEGVRVLYLLPRPWTDEILPLTLTPQPNELTRVMVGRAEVITAQVETNLFQLLTQAQTGDETARVQTMDELKKLGRFASPALQLATAHNPDPKFISFSFQFLYPPQLPANVGISPALQFN
jgi:hypothetical protein